jgi:nitroimidazol reductase NimA-like FMN-containing flavoprotein (pyridoxamine 5'-phosphate oxidase superfamily)
MTEAAPSLGQTAERHSMKTPVTTIDQRYSDPAAVATGWEETRRVLETAELSWISTVRADGRPHVTPLVGVWAEGAMHFCTGATEQKAVNLSANAHVTLTTGCSQWDEGLDVVIEGDAVQVTDDDALTRLAGVWATKWDGRWQYLVRDGCFYHPSEDAALAEPVLVFSVVPVRVLAFGKGAFSHTSHRF